MEVVLCSTSGKPIFHYKITLNDVLKASICKQQQEENDSRSVSFSCSLQGLVSFVSCMTQGEKIQEIQLEKSRCIFHLVDPITCVIIIREEKDKSAIQIIETTSLKRLLELLYAQILFILTDRGLDVLRKQPSYDLRELLIGTERTMRSLTNGWYRHVSLHMKDMGIRFLRMHPMDRMEITKAIEANTHTTKMICGILLANEQVVAIVQPNKKQFGILVDGKL
jgi:hypothetical protein